MGIGDVLSKLGSGALSYGKSITPGGVARGAIGLESGLFAKAPLTAIGVAGGGMLGLAQLVAPVVKGAYNDVTNDPFERQLRQETSALLRSQAEQLKRQRLEQGMAINEQRLQQYNPHLYNSIMAGRPLPRGAVPIGGGQRKDLVDLVTRQMAEGTL